MELRSFAAVVGAAPGAARLPGEGSRDFPSHFHADILSGGGSGLLKRPVLKDGFPAIFYSDDELSLLAQPLQFAIIGKFQFAIPRIEDVRHWIQGQRCKGPWKAGVLDGRHILLTFSNEEDYSAVFSQVMVRINGKLVKFLKWSLDYDPAKESPVAPVWFKFPGIKPHLFNQHSLFSIGFALGFPLQADTSTAKFARPSVARLLVERDVTADYPEKIWIGSELNGYWQRIEAEFVPHYCSCCSMFGHLLKDCFRAHPELRLPHNSKDNVVSNSTLDPNTAPFNRGLYSHQKSTPRPHLASTIVADPVVLNVLTSTAAEDVPAALTDANTGSFTREAIRIADQILQPPPISDGLPTAGTFTMEAMKMAEQVEHARKDPNLVTDRINETQDPTLGSFTIGALNLLAQVENNAEFHKTPTAQQDAIQFSESSSVELVDREEDSPRVPESIDMDGINIQAALEAANEEWQFQKRRRGRPKKGRDLPVLGSSSSPRVTRSKAAHTQIVTPYGGIRIREGLPNELDPPRKSPQLNYSGKGKQPADSATTWSSRSCSHD